MRGPKVIDLGNAVRIAPTASPEEEGLRALVAQHGSPLLLVDAGEIRAQFGRLRDALPQVDLHYAVKSLPQLEVIRIVSALGAGLDLATSGEVELAREAGVLPRRTIHTHPIKKDAEIRHALRYGCTTFVFDNVAELDKLTRYRSRVGLLLRVAFREPTAVCDLSRKFGCTPAEVPQLLAAAGERGLQVKGLSFHVGSQSGSSATHVQAIHTCRDLMSEARRAGTARPYVLDIGGGFPVAYHHPVASLESFCAPIRDALDTLPASTRVLAEPGRVLVAGAGVSVSTVVGRSERDGRMWYYLDDGLYGSYSGQMYDHASYPIEVFRDGPTRPSVLAGPTCDSIDVIAADLDLPSLDVGDLVVGRAMGAYTAASATDFNLVPRARVLVLDAAASLARPA